MRPKLKMDRSKSKAKGRVAEKLRLVAGARSSIKKLHARSFRHQFSELTKNRGRVYIVRQTAGRGDKTVTAPVSAGG